MTHDEIRAVPGFERALIAESDSGVIRVTIVGPLDLPVVLAVTSLGDGTFRVSDGGRSLRAMLDNVAPAPDGIAWDLSEDALHEHAVADARKAGGVDVTPSGIISAVGRGDALAAVLKASRALGGDNAIDPADGGLPCLQDDGTFLLAFLNRETGLYELTHPDGRVETFALEGEAIL